MKEICKHDRLPEYCDTCEVERLRKALERIRDTTDEEDTWEICVNSL